MNSGGKTEITDKPKVRGRQRETSDNPVGNRILEALDGRNQRWLSEAADISDRTLSDYVKRGISSAEAAVSLARALGVSVDWLLTGNGKSNPLSSPKGHDEEVLPSGSVMVQEIDLAYGMGSTYLDVAAVEPRAIPFPRDWLRTFTRSDPEHLFFARGDGDSMMPTILDQDIVLIDRSQIAINRQDRIWAVAYGELGMIKRVRAMPDGSYQLLSDNPNVEPAVAVDGEMTVIGRVVAVIRRT